jgi:hypothetical protein
MIVLLCIAIGAVYFYKIDYFLPPAMSLALIPLITQLRAALLKISKINRACEMKSRVRQLEKDSQQPNT